MKIATPAEYSGTCSGTYLQVLVHLEEPGALSENPDDNETTPLPGVISAGPYVYAPGAQAVFDMAGRELDCRLEGDYLDVSSFSAGTYTVKTPRGLTKLIKIR